ncbi:MAG: ABC transporter ATP-binding protein [Actinobacteria bacterium]|nr:ABC transporter ATP-binding protein [Actinomycetota bacterium]
MNEIELKQSNEKLELQVDKLTKRFGGLTAVSNFNFNLKRGELVSLIGPNGAGKTTVFNLLTGILKIDSGHVVFKGEDITNKPPHVISVKGLIRTFQNLRLLSGMSVMENIRPVFHSRLAYSPFSALVGNQSFQRLEDEMNDKIENVLEKLHIAEYRDTNVSDLSYGIQRRVEIARALAFDPKILLLDEPTAGLTPKEADEIIRLIQAIRDDLGFSIIIVEHNMRVVMSISRRITVMNQGKIITEGTPEEIQTNKEVIRAYLGETKFNIRK